MKFLILSITNVVEMEIIPDYDLIVPISSVRFIKFHEGFLDVRYDDLHLSMNFAHEEKKGFADFLDFLESDKKTFSLEGAAYIAKTKVKTSEKKLVLKEDEYEDKEVETTISFFRFEPIDFCDEEA